MWDFEVKSTEEIQEILEIMDMLCKKQSDNFRVFHNPGTDEKPKSMKELTMLFECDIFEVSDLKSSCENFFKLVRDYGKIFKEMFPSSDWNYSTFINSIRYMRFIFELLNIKYPKKMKYKQNLFSDLVLFIDEEFKNNLDPKDIEILEYYYGIHRPYRYEVEEISEIKKISQYQIGRSIKRALRALRLEKDKFLEFLVVE